MSETDCLLKLTDVSKSFEQPGGQRLHVLRGLSLCLDRGEILALMGPNGCGKTTLLNIIAGDLMADEGTVRIGGVILSKWPPYRRARLLGRVHQESYKALASELTVREILAIARKRQETLCARFPEPASALATIRSFSEGAASFLTSRLDVQSSALSGGQRQLLALASAVLGGPRLLILDEHKASLDAEFTRMADELVLGLVSGAVASAIVVTHDRQWVRSAASCAALFEDGRVKLVEIEELRANGPA